MRFSEGQILEFETGSSTPLESAIWKAFLYAARMAYFQHGTPDAKYFRDLLRRRWKMRSLKHGAEVLIRPAASNLEDLFRRYKVLTPPMAYQTAVQGVNVYGRYVLLKSHDGGVWLPQTFWTHPANCLAAPSTADLCRWIYVVSAGLIRGVLPGIVWFSASDGREHRFSGLQDQPVREILDKSILYLQDVMKTSKKETIIGAAGDRMAVTDKKTGKVKYVLFGDQIEEIPDEEADETQDSGIETGIEKGE